MRRTPLSLTLTVQQAQDLLATFKTLSDAISDKLEHPKLTIDVYHDDDPDDPRTWDNITTMAFFHKSYDLGDKEPRYNIDDYDTWDDLRNAIIKDEDPLIIKSVFMLDHSGITISTSDFHDPWDSGMIGFVWISKKSCGSSWDESIAHATPVELDQMLETEIKIYDQFLRGEVYGYRILEDGEDIDSCWGLYADNIDDLKDQIEADVPAEYKGLIKDLDWSDIKYI